jgi:hypothetical protein
VIFVYLEYLVVVRPFKWNKHRTDLRNEKIALFNQFSLMVLCYLSIVFAFTEVKLKFMMGWIYIAVVGVIILVNLLDVVIYTIVPQLRQKYRMYFWKKE